MRKWDVQGKLDRPQTGRIQSACFIQWRERKYKTWAVAAACMHCSGFVHECNIHMRIFTTRSHVQIQYICAHTLTYAYTFDICAYGHLKARWTQNDQQREHTEQKSVSIPHAIAHMIREGLLFADASSRRAAADLQRFVDKSRFLLLTLSK